MTRAEALAAALFIRHELIPANRDRGDTVLTPGEVGKRVERLRRLANTLDKSSITKRQNETFKKLLARELVETYVSAAIQFRTEVSDLSIRSICENMAASIGKKRGRPRLTQIERRARVSKGYTTHERNRWKIKRALRAEVEDAKFIEELRTNGKTILTL